MGYLDTAFGTTLPAQQDTQEAESTTYNSVPSWLKAADLHNLGNNNASLIADENMSVFDKASKFLRTTMIAGTNEIYNIPATVGSWVGANTTLRSNEEAVAQFDSNLTDFYLQHQDTVDTFGFMLGSLVPGMAGTKVANAGQRALSTMAKSGKLGGTLGKAVGLLSPSHDMLLQKAVSEITAPNATFKILRGSTLKLLGEGFVQNTFETAAFETAVAATMYKSPVFEHMDAQDMFWNMAAGAGLGGIIGGSLSGFSTWGKIKQGVRAIENKIGPGKVIFPGFDSASPAERAATLIIGKGNLPSIPTKTGDAIQDAVIDKMTQVHGDTIKTYNVHLRTALADLTKGDGAIAQALYENLRNLPTQDALNTLIQAQEAGKLSTTLFTERELNRLGKKVLDLNASEAETLRYGNLSVRYLKVHGQDAGEIYDTTPPIFNLADTLKKGESITVKGNKVTAGSVRDYTFNIQKPWDIFKSDHLETEARFIWAERIPALREGTILHENDIPLLTKALDDKLTSVSVKLEDGATKLFDATSEDYMSFLIDKKADLRLRLAQMPKAVEHSTPEEKIAYLKKTLKIDFSVVDSAKYAAATGESEFIAAHANEISQKLLKVFADDNPSGLKQILVSKQAIDSTPINRIIQALKHEQGHSFYQALVDVGGVDVKNIAALRAELTPISKRMRPGLWKRASKLDYLLNTRTDPSIPASLHELMADAYSFASMHPAEMKRLAPKWWAEFGDSVHPVPQSLLDAMHARTTQLTADEIAKMVDVTMDATHTDTRDITLHFARKAAVKEYTDRMIALGNRTADEVPTINLDNVPSVVRMTYDRTPVLDKDGNTLKGAAILMQKQRLLKDSRDTVFAAFIPPEYAKQYGDIPMELIYQANPIDAPGRTILGATNSNYNSLGNFVENLGKATNNLKIARGEEVKEALEPALYKLRNSTESAIEWEVLNQRLRNVPENYVFDATRKGFVPRSVLEYNKSVESAIAAGEDASKIKVPQLEPGVPEFIPVKNDATVGMIKAHIDRVNKHISARGAMNSTDGIADSRRVDTFYPTAPNPANFKHFVFVVDRSVAGFERSRMIYAQTEEQLAELVSKVKKDMPASWEILTKKDSEAWHKAIGDFEFEKSIKDVAFDSELHRRGVSSPVIVPTNPTKIVTDYLESSIQQEHRLVMDLVAYKYQPQFDMLRQMGDNYTSIATSQKGSLKSLVSYAENMVRNPYTDYVKTALGLPRTSEYNWWFTPQRYIDTKISQLYDNISTLMDSPTDVNLDEINAMLKKYGYKGPNYDEAMNKWANYTAPKNVLSNFTAKANSILASLTLRLDFLNAAVNAISSNILYYPELRGIIKAIESGDQAAVGKLTELAKVKIPGGSDYILSPAKLHATAIKNYFKALRGDPEFTKVLQTYRDYGFLTRISDQYKYVLDELTLTGQEAAPELATKIKGVQDFLVKLTEKGEKLTGNRLAEEYNRFIAADSARQLFQLGVDHGIISESQMWANVNTFVNRTQGTYQAAFRPAILQGPVGQAVGLFQTYQLNLMQQLFRHVSEGSMKDAMLMTGLQGTIYGLNGLPAFNLINTHILGNMTGNPEHKDIYYHVYSGAGKEAGDWLMYGAASNILSLVDKDLRMNIYARGDINPRHLTIVPTSLADIPIVNAWSKTLGGIKQGLQNIQNGGDIWNSFLTGVEHASVNRPLAGLAQILEATDNPQSLSYSTNSKGNIIASNDLLSLANLTRLTGGKPFDDAIMQDLGYRMQVYAINTQEKKQALANAIKSSLYKGKTPSEDQITQFARTYVNIGGQQKQWNQFWVKQLVNANMEQGERIARTLKTPALQKLQVLMGGIDMQSESIDSAIEVQ